MVTGIMRETNSYRVAAATDNDAVSAKLDYLIRELEHLKMGHSGANPQDEMEGVNYVHQGGNRNFNNYRPNQGGGNYNHYGNKVHPNLLYGNSNNALQPPPSFTVSQGMITEPKKKSTEEIMNDFIVQSQKNMQHSNQQLEKVETDVHSMALHMKSLDTQISQIAQAVSNQHKPGQFPGQTTVNLKDCKAIHLSSGTSYEGPSVPEAPPKPTVEPEVVLVEEVEDQTEKEEIETSPPAEQLERNTPPKPSDVRVPFPQMLQKKKQNEQLMRTQPTRIMH